MFSYDAQLLAILNAKPKSIAEVISMLEAIEATCADEDGLKWFNWLYLGVTKAVAEKAPSVNDPAWLSELDIRFAEYYFDALRRLLSHQPASGCWRILMERRADTRVARIQFALAGINAHINHDLCAAVVDTCEATNTRPVHGDAHYRDYTDLNPTLDARVDEAKKVLMVRLLGDVLPPVNSLENTLAAWSVAAAREKAWLNAEHVWHLRALPLLKESFFSSIDGFSTVIGKTLLVPVP